MKSNIASLIAVALGLHATSAKPAFPLAPVRTISPVQQRMQAAWEADAPRRNALRLEIAVWNSQVKRRNQRFVARQLARGRTA